jgi:hypothetical protein
MERTEGTAVNVLPVRTRCPADVRDSALARMESHAWHYCPQSLRARARIVAREAKGAGIAGRFRGILGPVPVFSPTRSRLPREALDAEGHMARGQASQHGCSPCLSSRPSHRGLSPRTTPARSARAAIQNARAAPARPVAIIMRNGCALNLSETMSCRASRVMLTTRVEPGGPQKPPDAR